MRHLITSSIAKNWEKNLKKIKPNYSENFKKRRWEKMCEVLSGLCFGQSCFINTIVENTPHYKKEQKKFEKGKRNTMLDKNEQIKKISNYLCFPLDRLISSYLFYLRIHWFGGNNEKAKHAKKMGGIGGIEHRLNNQKLCLHDGSDLIKDYAKKMENLCAVRDGSKSSKTKAITGNGYLLEGCVAIYKNRIHPLFLSLFSTQDKNYLNDKEETKKNLINLAAHQLADMFLHVFDRGYDSVSFMSFCISNGINFLIRATLSRTIILVSDFEESIKETKTQADRLKIFYPITSLVSKLTFNTSSQHKYHWFEIAWTKVYIKGPRFIKDASDVILVNFIAVRIINKSIEGIEEDLNINKKEREIFFYTTQPIHSLDDAIVIFLSYLKRWKIETYFRYIKQVFNLEKVCVMKFKKIKNLCSLLVIATQFLYKHFHDFEKTEEEKLTKKLKMIFKKDAVKRDDKTILAELLYFSYLHYCTQKNFTHNPDSFAKFIKDVMWNSIQYPQHIINYKYFDSS